MTRRAARRGIAEAVLFLALMALGAGLSTAILHALDRAAACAGAS